MSDQDQNIGNGSNYPPAANPLPPAGQPMPGGQQSNGMATASLVLSIIGIMTAFFLIGFLFAILALIFGIKGVNRAKQNPPMMIGYGQALAGTIISSITLALFIPMIGIMAAIAIPNFINLRQKAYDASAKSAGRNAKLAEEVFYIEQEGENKTYTTNISDLIEIDPHLTADPQVTFVFTYGSTDGFTLHTTHAEGTGKTFEYSGKP